MPQPIVECQGVCKTFEGKRGGHRFEVRAVQDVDFRIEPGQTVGLVGESGSGKSTLGRLIAGLTPPSQGTVLVDGRPAAGTGRRLRRRLQVVWQDPFSSMNGKDSIETILTEAAVVHGLVPRGQQRARAEQILASVGLPSDLLQKGPNELSGGQLQRVAIGRALALEPELIVCDEVTSALDVSVQAQILNLLHEVQVATNVAYVFISHDLHVVRHVSDSVMVMFGGRVVETGDAETVYASPAHPYTQELVHVARDRAVDDRAETEAPDMERGCPYRGACPLRREICEQVVPQLAPAANGALAACHVNAPAGGVARVASAELRP